MSKHNKKKTKKLYKGIITAVVLVVLLTTMVLFVMPQLLYKIRNEDSITDLDAAVSTPETQAAESVDHALFSGEAETAVDPVNAVSFPLLLKNGKLEIESAFQFDGINPDCGNQAGNDIAAIAVKNLSDTYLASADITMILASGDALQFTVTDLPAGKSVMAFSVDNATTDSSTVYSDVTCQAVFEPEASMHEDMLSVSTEGTLVTLQNNTDAEIKELVVYCRSTLGDQYFVGITYPYTVTNLPANGTAELDAVDCILGLAEVVRIEIS